MAAWARVGVNVTVPVPGPVMTTGTVTVPPLMVIGEVRSMVTTQPPLEYSWIPGISGSTSVNEAAESAYPVGTVNPDGKAMVTLVGIVLPAVTVTAPRALEAVAPTMAHEPATPVTETEPVGAKAPVMKNRTVTVRAAVSWASMSGVRARSMAALPTPAPESATSRSPSRRVEASISRPLGAVKVTSSQVSHCAVVHERHVDAAARGRVADGGARRR